MNSILFFDQVMHDAPEPPDRKQVRALLKTELAAFDKKIIVLDDDPTGIQTVHQLSVYTDWSEASLIQGFAEKAGMFFVLTNSRSFTQDQTRCAHQEMARNILGAAKKTGRDFLIISRSDSTLRGHYPIETLVLKEQLESATGRTFDGEILLPFFMEGGRYTINNIHYVREGSRLVPAAQTDYAHDKAFGYASSHLGEWCEEKTEGAYKAKDLVYIALEDLRACRIDWIEQQLAGISGFNKIIVNALDYVDVEVFAIALLRAMKQGKTFMIRSAAALPKVLSGLPDRPLLGRDELITPDQQNGGIVLIGSHVKKTSDQLAVLRESGLPLDYIEFNQHLVLVENGLEQEVDRIVTLAEEKIKAGRTVVVYTRRDRLDLNTDDKDQQLAISVRISDAITGIVGRLSIRPGFILAKGGITASDVGTKALKVKRALVLGQIKPGIPVWLTGEESKFPRMPYIIFPGNVGDSDTLKEIVLLLTGRE